MFWQIHLGLHEGLWLNHGPWGAPLYHDRVTYVSPGFVFGWRW